jgi:hypothetical protein
MKATFKQEWKASKSRILYTSLVLAIVLLGAALTNFIAFQTQSNHVTFFGMFMYSVGIFCTLAIPIYALIRGSGNLRQLLFSDTNYLMLLVPEHSYTLLLAKQLINLAEYLIYVIPAAFYLSFMGPTAGLSMHTTLNGILYNANPGSTYWESVKSIYKYVFVDNWAGILQLLAMAIIMFTVLQAAINCAYALYSAFIHTKRPNKFLILVILFFLFYIPIRLGFLGIDQVKYHIQNLNSAVIFWNYIWRFAVFGIVYFFLTGWLMENKIEV